MTIVQKVTSVILTLRVLILTRSIRVPVARASKEMVLIARVSLFKICNIFCKITIPRISFIRSNLLNNIYMYHASLMSNQKCAYTFLSLLSGALSLAACSLF